MASSYLKKPEWLKIRLANTEEFAQTEKIITERHLNTICISGKCPNRCECWNRGTATFMIGGEICTRSCKFCNTLSGRPNPLDVNEPTKVAESIKLMHLRHVVITSVDRDDLPDLGAGHWSETIHKIKELNPGVTIEVLIPDFQGKVALIEKIVDASPNVISHNIETVRRLTPVVRSAANYDKSLSVLYEISQRGIKTKSGLMLGLGEKMNEVLDTMDDLRAAGCAVLTMGQYLQPTRNHYPVQQYVSLEMFAHYKEEAIKRGFQYVESGPLVRSSYYAEKHI